MTRKFELGQDFVQCT